MTKSAIEPATAVKVAVVQTGGISEDPGTAVEFLLTQFREAAAAGPDVVLFSELCNTPYFGLTGDDKYRQWAEPLDGPTVTAFRTAAGELRTGVILGIYERGDDGALYNSAVVIDAEGNLVEGTSMFGGSVPCYRKSSIPMGAGSGYPVNEKQFFEPGNGPVVFDAFGMRFSTLICYDRSFPEYWESARTMGADAVFVLVSSFGKRQGHFTEELQIRARESQCYAIAANRGGEETLGGRTVSSFGLSCVIEPDTTIVAQAPAHQQPYILHSEIDLEKVSEFRRVYRFQRDKNPQVFARLAEMKLAGLPGSLISA